MITLGALAIGVSYLLADEYMPLWLRRQKTARTGLLARFGRPRTDP